MPTYTLTNTLTNETNDVFMSISEKEEFLKTHPHYKQELVPVNIGDGFYYGTPGGKNKPAPEFRERLREIKKAHVGSNVNTWD